MSGRHLISKSNWYLLIDCLHECHNDITLCRTFTSGDYRSATALSKPNSASAAPSAFTSRSLDSILNILISALEEVWYSKRFRLLGQHCVSRQATWTPCYINLASRPHPHLARLHIPFRSPIHSALHLLLFSRVWSFVACTLIQESCLDLRWARFRATREILMNCLVSLHFGRKTLLEYCP